MHLTGAGEGKHVEYNTTSDSSLNSSHEKDFTFSVSVFPDPCNTGTVKVYIEKFGPDTLTYIDSEDESEVELTSIYSYMWIMLDSSVKEESGFRVLWIL